MGEKVQKTLYVPAKACLAMSMTSSGRPPTADAAAVHHICIAAQLSELSNAAAMAAKIEQHLGLHLSRSAMERLLRGNGLSHPRPFNC